MFFAVFNTTAHKTYSFTINNMSNNHTLYHQGSMFLGYSVKQSKFFRVGKNLTFYNSFIKKEDLTNLYSCYFELEFPEDNDEYYLSLTHPYTYSRLNSLLNEIRLTTHSQIEVTQE